MTPENQIRISPKIFFDDHEDRKTLDTLIEKLFNSPKPVGGKSPSSKWSASKGSSECSEDVTRNPQRKVRKKSKNNCLLDGWITKSPKKPESCKTKSAKTCEVKNKGLAKPKKRQFKRNSSGSFDKYGVRLPSYDDIIASQKKYDDHKECVDKLNKMDYSHDSLELDIDEPLPSTIILDCKHLSKKELQSAFYKNYKYVYDIYNGFQPSVRHERFKKKNHKDLFTVKDLTYNTSMTTFTFEQKQELLTCLQKEFAKNELCQNDQYFFKVLLPELCTKIFMDVHNMSHEDATAYLEEQPVEDASAV